MVRHCVWVKLRDDVAGAERQRVCDQLRDIGNHSPGMVACHFSENTSPEGLDRGYKFGFVMDFDSVTARDAYLVHPAHQAAAAELLKLTQGGVDGVLVFDLTI